MSGCKRCMGILVIGFLLMVCGTMRAKASGVGNIRIELSDTETRVERKGVVFGYTKVAMWEEGEWSGIGIGKGVDFSKIKTAEQMEQVTNYLYEHIETRDGTCTTDETGCAVLTGLERGIYLIDPIVCGAYGKIQPMLVELPFWNEIEGTFEYDIRVVPKYEQQGDAPPIAPQTNLNDNYGRMMLAALFSFGCGLLALTYSMWRKRHEEHL